MAEGYTHELKCLLEEYPGLQCEQAGITATLLTVQPHLLPAVENISKLMHFYWNFMILRITKGYFGLHLVNG